MHTEFVIQRHYTTLMTTASPWQRLRRRAAAAAECEENSIFYVSVIVVCRHACGVVPMAPGGSPPICSKDKE